MGAAPYGTEAATVLHYNTIQNDDDLISLQWSQYDYAVIHLATPFTGLGTMGLEADFPGGSADVTGYPASAQGAQVTYRYFITKIPGYTRLPGHVTRRGLERRAGLDGRQRWAATSSASSPPRAAPPAISPR